MKLFKNILLTISLIVFLGCAVTLPGPGNDHLYDYNNHYVNPKKMNLDSIVKSVVPLWTETIFTVKLPNSEEIREAKPELDGRGVLIGNYIITVKHNVTNEKLITQVITPFGITEVEVPGATKVRDDRYLKTKQGGKIKLEVVFDSDEKDMMIFKKPDIPGLVSFPYEIGNADILMTGNFIYIIGWPASLQYQVRAGIIGSVLPPPENVKSILPDPSVAFMMALAVNPGDSGGPVIAIRDGKYELVGLTQGIYTELYDVAWGVKINAFLEEIQKLEGVEDVLPD